MVSVLRRQRLGTKTVTGPTCQRAGRERYVVLIRLFPRLLCSRITMLLYLLGEVWVGGSAESIIERIPACISALRCEERAVEVQTLEGGMRLWEVLLVWLDSHMHTE